MSSPNYQNIVNVPLKISKKIKMPSIGQKYSYKIILKKKKRKNYNLKRKIFLMKKKNLNGNFYLKGCFLENENFLFYYMKIVNFFKT
jgi:hypothetical protein